MKKGQKKVQYTDELAVKAYYLHKNGLTWKKTGQKLGISDRSARLWGTRAEEERIYARAARGSQGNGIRTRTIRMEIEKWVTKYPQMLDIFATEAHKKFIKHHTKVNHAYFSQVIKRIRDKKKLPAKIQKKSKQIDKKLNKIVKTNKGLKEAKTINNEIEFLRWWNQGERKGYVDLLLSELEK